MSAVEGDVSLAWLVGSALPAARRFGVEHEFSVRRGDTTVDFRSVLSSSGRAGRRLDRSDPFARRMAWGGVVTADGAEAECATPPALLVPGFTDRILSWVETGHRELQSIAGGARLHGYSTHVNVEVDDRRAVRLAERFAQRHSAALMLLMDQEDSPGLLVRPRRARLELGGEYVTGEQLVAASVFAAAATRECERNRSARRLVSPRVVPARGRFGVYVDRCAFGGDLSTHGRRARVGRYTGQDLLTWSWERCRTHALEFAAPHEIAVVDAVVGGSSPLPSECLSIGGCPSPGRIGADPAFDITRVRVRGAMTLEPILATWDHVCFMLEIGGVGRVVAVRADAADRLADAFESGALDAWCRTVAGLDPRRLEVLSSADQIGSGGGVFSSLDPDATLVPAERNPRTGRPGGVGNVPGQRQQKNHDETPPRRLGRKHFAGIAAAGAVVIAGAVAVVATRDDGSSTSAAQTTVVTVPEVTSPATTEAAAVVPVTDPATTAIPETTLPPSVCSSTDLAADPAGAGAPQPVAPGADVAAQGAGAVGVVIGSATSRLDAGTTVTCTDASTLSQTGGRTWTRTGGDPLVVHTPLGDVTIAPGSIVVVDCRADGACTVIAIQGSASGPTGEVTAPAAVSLTAGLPVQPLTYDAVFGDPWMVDNAVRDVAAGLPNPADAFVSYGPSAASLSGHFTGQRTVTTAECTGPGQCDVGTPLGDVADRAYDFSVDCSSTPCVGTVAVQFTLNDATQVAQVPLSFDGTSYSWDVNTTTYQCTFDKDGNGTYESQFGSVTVAIHYVLTPTAAEVRNGQYVVTSFHAIGDAVNTVVAADPQCGSGFGPSHNVGDITASR